MDRSPHPPLELQRRTDTNRGPCRPFTPDREHRDLDDVRVGSDQGRRDTRLQQTTPERQMLANSDWAGAVRPCVGGCSFEDVRRPRVRLARKKPKNIPPAVPPRERIANFGRESTYLQNALPESRQNLFHRRAEVLRTSARPGPGCEGGDRGPHGGLNHPRPGGRNIPHAVQSSQTDPQRPECITHLPLAPQRAHLSLEDQELQVCNPPFVVGIESNILTRQPLIECPGVLLRIPSEVRVAVIEHLRQRLAKPEDRNCPVRSANERLPCRR